METMERWRTKEFQDAQAQAEGLLHCSPENVADALAAILPPRPGSSAPVLYTPSFPSDTGLPAWASEQARLRGGAAWMRTWIEHPVADLPTLAARRRALHKLARHVPRVTSALARLAPAEEDVLWILTRPELSHAWPMPLLFPTWPVISAINRAPLLLHAFHMFRIYVAPWMNLAYPLATLLGPWIYLRRNLGWEVPFTTYCGMLRLALREVLRPSGDHQKDAARYGTLLVYATIYIYGIFQSIDMSMMLHRLRKQLLERSRRILAFVREAEEALRAVPARLLAPFLPASSLQDAWQEGSSAPPLASSLPAGVRGAYTLWTDAALQDRVRGLLQRVYALDMAVTAAGWRERPGWCAVRFCEGSLTAPEILGMGHPMLGSDQVRNPASLRTNLLLTGPNAAGKTTYAKAVCSNLWMAHVFGIACAAHMRVPVFHAFGSFVRIEDTLGTESLFEAETRRCAELVRLAEAASAAGQRAFFFLDEPMHSTPPTEGASVATAVSRYMGELPGVRLIVTTHYHAMTSHMGPLYKNVSMEAVRLAGGAIHFPYQVRAGPSFQCIALELLQTHDLPERVLAGAAETREIICRGMVSGDES